MLAHPGRGEYEKIHPAQVPRDVGSGVGLLTSGQEGRMQKTEVRRRSLSPPAVSVF
jgi:hypothetical protein